MVARRELWVDFKIGTKKSWRRYDGKNRTLMT